MRQPQAGGPEGYCRSNWEPQPPSERQQDPARARLHTGEHKLPSFRATQFAALRLGAPGC